MKQLSEPVKPSEACKMAGKLLPHPDLSPQIPDDSTPQQCLSMWLDLMKTCDKFLLAGLRREVGEDGDLQEAYRQWYAERCREHDRTVSHMMSEAKRREQESYDN